MNNESAALLASPALVASILAATNQSNSIPTQYYSSKRKHTTSEKYAPCSCGSGEKFKFCCMNRKKETIADKIAISLEEFADELEGKENLPVQEET